eukprot:gnl/Hemi2/8430_TR2912_c0_g1_i1.p1 gnl/Hemi2/8430_TR2912_c0_g1~~gnl/Hemi2/8430_TR2912_c0_g1_i1.p1  ORF type:complete len:288 (-),score=14.87 gnl/Hemi2/8430_TR2912_c0_g1_i1:58-921(-)
MSSKRYLFFRNSSVKDGKAVILEPDATLDWVKDAVSRKFAMTVARIFTLSGQEVRTIEELLSLDEDSQLYVSAGEGYQGGRAGKGAISKAEATVVSICVVGPAQSGKGALASCFGRGVYDRKESSLEAMYTVTLEVEGRDFCVNVLDSSGLEENLSRSSSVLACQGYVLTFDIENRHTFSDLLSIHHDIVEARRKRAQKTPGSPPPSSTDTSAPFVIVGLHFESQFKRVVSESEAMLLAYTLNESNYVEACLETKHNVQLPFLMIIRRLYFPNTVTLNQQNQCCTIL